MFILKHQLSKSRGISVLLGAPFLSPLLPLQQQCNFCRAPTGSTKMAVVIVSQHFAASLSRSSLLRCWK